MKGWPMIGRNHRVAGFVVLLVLGCGNQPQPRDRGAGRGALRGAGDPSSPTKDASTDTNASPSGEGPVDRHVAALLGSTPSAGEFVHLSRNILREPGDAQFIATLLELSRSATPQVARLSTQILSRGYHLAQAENPTTAQAIESALETGDFPMRQSVLRNLDQVDTPEVRRWLGLFAAGRGGSGGSGHAAELMATARASLASLDKRQEDGLAVTPSMKFQSTSSMVGASRRVDSGAPGFDLVIEIEAIRMHTSPESGLPEPFATGTFTVMSNGSDAKMAVLRLEDVPIFGGDYVETPDLALLVWCRALGEEEARTWFLLSYPLD